MHQSIHSWTPKIHAKCKFVLAKCDRVKQNIMEWYICVVCVDVTCPIGIIKVRRTDKRKIFSTENADSSFVG